MMISPGGMIIQRALSLRYPAARDFVISLVSRILTLCSNACESRAKPVGNARLAVRKLRDCARQGVQHFPPQALVWSWFAR